jgi:hypothetical protein
MPIIPATQEAGLEVGEFEDSMVKGVDQEVECLPRKHEVLGSISSTEKNSDY